VSKGGHSVDENTIRERFAKGLDLLDASFDRFDTVYIYQSVSKLIRGLYILEPKAKRAGLIAPIPTALKSRLPRLTEFVAMNCG
jgi:predicted ABC-type ATPase